MNDVSLIKNLLTKRRISQKHLAIQSGVSQVHISRILRGHVKLTNKMMNRLVSAISQIE